MKNQLLLALKNFGTYLAQKPENQNLFNEHFSKKFKYLCDKIREKLELGSSKQEEKRESKNDEKESSLEDKTRDLWNLLEENWKELLNSHEFRKDIFKNISGEENADRFEISDAYFLLTTTLSQIYQVPSHLRRLLIKNACNSSADNTTYEEFQSVLSNERVYGETWTGYNGYKTYAEIFVNSFGSAEEIKRIIDTTEKLIQTLAAIENKSFFDALIKLLGAEHLRKLLFNAGHLKSVAEKIKDKSFFDGLIRLLGEQHLQQAIPDMTQLIRVSETLPLENKALLASLVKNQKFLGHDKLDNILSFFAVEEKPHPEAKEQKKPHSKSSKHLFEWLTALNADELKEIIRVPSNLEKILNNFLGNPELIKSFFKHIQQNNIDQDIFNTRENVKPILDFLDKDVKRLFIPNLSFKTLELLCTEKKISPGDKADSIAMFCPQLLEILLSRGSFASGFIHFLEKCSPENRLAVINHLSKTQLDSLCASKISDNNDEEKESKHPKETQALFFRILESLPEEDKKTFINKFDQPFLIKIFENPPALLGFLRTLTPEIMSQFLLRLGKENLSLVLRRMPSLPTNILQTMTTQQLLALVEFLGNASFKIDVEFFNLKNAQKKDRFALVKEIVSMKTMDPFLKNADDVVSILELIELTDQDNFWNILIEKRPNLVKNNDDLIKILIKASAHSHAAFIKYLLKRDHWEQSITKESLVNILKPLSLEGQRLFLEHLAKKDKIRTLIKNNSELEDVLAEIKDTDLQTTLVKACIPPRHVRLWNNLKGHHAMRIIIWGALVFGFLSFATLPVTLTFLSKMSIVLLSLAALRVFAEFLQVVGKGLFEIILSGLFFAPGALITQENAFFKSLGYLLAVILNIPGIIFKYVGKAFNAIGELIAGFHWQVAKPIEKKILDARVLDDKAADPSNVPNADEDMDHKHSYNTPLVKKVQSDKEITNDDKPPLVLYPNTFGDYPLCIPEIRQSVATYKKHWARSVSAFFATSKNEDAGSYTNMAKAIGKLF